MMRTSRKLRVAAAAVSLALVTGMVAPAAYASPEPPPEAPISSVPGGIEGEGGPVDPGAPTEPVEPIAPGEPVDPEIPIEEPAEGEIPGIDVPAVDPEADPVDVLLEEIMGKYGEEVLEGPSDAESALIVDIPGMEVTIPQDATQDDVSLKLGDLPALTVEMPAEAVDATAPDVIEGSVVYENTETGAASAVQALEEKAVRMTVSVPNPDAPQTYSFDLGLQEGMKAFLLIDGSISVTTPHMTDDSQILDMPVYQVAAPWAKDSNGSDVHTWYTLEGSTVTQHMAPTPEHVYPIVMDPTFMEQVDSLTEEARTYSRKVANNTADYNNHYPKWQTEKAKADGLPTDISDANTLVNQAQADVNTKKAEYNRRISDRDRYKRNTPTWTALNRGASDYKRDVLDPAERTLTSRQSSHSKLKTALKTAEANRDFHKKKWEDAEKDRKAAQKALDSVVTQLESILKARANDWANATKSRRGAIEIVSAKHDGKFCISINKEATTDLLQNRKNACEKAGPEAQSAYREYHRLDDLAVQYATYAAYAAGGDARFGSEMANNKAKMDYLVQASQEANKYWEARDLIDAVNNEIRAANKAASDRIAESAQVSLVQDGMFTEVTNALAQKIERKYFSKSLSRDSSRFYDVALTILRECSTGQPFTGDPSTDAEMIRQWASEKGIDIAALGLALKGFADGATSAQVLAMVIRVLAAGGVSGTQCQRAVELVEFTLIPTLWTGVAIELTWDILVSSMALELRDFNTARASAIQSGACLTATTTVYQQSVSTNWSTWTRAVTEDGRMLRCG